VEEVNKGEILAIRKNWGRDRTVTILENSARDGVRGGGVGDSQKDAPEKLDPSFGTIIWI